MNEIDKIFKNNKDAFDRLEPREQSWEAIKKGYNQQQEPSISAKSTRRYSWAYKLAASILLIVAVSFLFYGPTIQSSSAFDNITLSSPQGTPVSLDPSLNKLTLVQFWESGNVLCSEENCYYYLPAYEKYKDQGFEIYAISLDEEKESWIAGIEENQLPWIHASDLKGWDSPICIECNISKTPTSFLLDQKGNVIAEDLNAEELDYTIGMLLAQN